MITSATSNVTKAMESNDAFYDSIAADYDGLMTSADETARDVISRLFCSRVPIGKVLDFGSGTGLDLSWLVASGYTVFSLEPSAGMRDEAKKRVSTIDGIKFIDESLDYRHWSETKLPISGANGILANFAVLNCMDDLPGFFNKIRLVLDPNGRLVVTVIDPGWHNVVKKYSYFVALRLLVQRELEVLRRHKGVYHKTYLYSKRFIEKVAHSVFILESCTPINGSGFVVLIFRPAR